MVLRSKVYLFLLSIVVLGFIGHFSKGFLSSKATNDSKQEESSSKQDEDQAIPVAVDIAVLGPITHSLTSTANLRHLREVEIASQSAGVVKSVNVEEGDFIKTGQKLCTLDDRELQIDLALAEQRLAQTRIQLESAKLRKEKSEIQIRNKRIDLERSEKALTEGLVAESEVNIERYQLDELLVDQQVEESTVKESLHRISELESEIHKVQLQISQTSISAPFDGRITERMVEQGQSVRVADKLFKLGTFSPMHTDVYLAEQDSRMVKPGQRVLIRLGTGADEVTVGKVLRVSPVVDAETGTVKVTAELRPHNQAFRPGSFVRVEIETDTRLNVVLIPKQAVIEEDGLSYAFVTDKEATAQRREIELGYQNGAIIEVMSGITAGEAVVIAGQGKLKDGDMTRIVSD